MIVCQRSFVDIVSGKPVYDCIDAFGRMWHANGAWSFFRVRKGLDWQEEQVRRQRELTQAFTDHSFYNFRRDDETGVGLT